MPRSTPNNTVTLNSRRHRFLLPFQSPCEYRGCGQPHLAYPRPSPYALAPLPAVQPVISKSSTTRLRFFPDLDHPPNEFALPPKLASQKVWVDDMLRKGFIRRSKSPYGANLTSASKGTDLFDGASTIDD